MAVDALFRLTGWIRDGWAEFGNTAKRRAELGDTLEAVCNRKRLKHSGCGAACNLRAGKFSEEPAVFA